MTNRELSLRPRPILDAFKSIGSAISLLGSMVTAFVGWGILTEVQGDALEGLLGAIPGLITLITSLLSAFGVVRRAEPLVTPMEDPRTDDGVRLVRSKLTADGAHSITDLPDRGSGYSST